MTTNKPTERPILFNGEMVRAILSGRKTQTRRVVPSWQLPSKTEGEDIEELRWISVAQRHPRWGFGVFGSTEEECMANYNNDYQSCCPYGEPGDRLWVRETFGYGSRPCPFEGAVDGIEYRADEAYMDEVELLPLYRPETPPDFCYGDIARSGWRPSIHMPRWASRITLEITGVRVDRLQGISEEDARAEGAPSVSFPLTESQRSNIDRFRALWNLIHGAGAWGENPWVWAIEFKRVEP